MQYYYFYAVTVNDHDALFCVTAEEAISELAMRLESDDSDTYGIERVDSIWDLIRRCGAFENYSDDWMIEVIGTVQYMIGQWDKVHREQEQKQELDQNQDPAQDKDNAPTEV